jgi:hypothetical protein
MTHCIQAVVARVAVLDEIQQRFPGVRTTALPQGFGMIPATDSLLASAAPDWQTAEPEAFRVMLSWAFLRTLLDFSRLGPVVYLETEYWGGDGGQAAVLLKEGRIAPGPLSEWTAAGAPPLSFERRLESPINRCLREAGVCRTRTEDEFDALGLGRFRGMEDFEEGESR